MLKRIDNFFGWIVWSSKDPEKVSLATKGVLTLVFTSIISSFNFFGVDLGVLNDLINPILDVISYALYTLSAVAVLVGSIRKVYLSLKGENKSLE